MTKFTGRRVATFGAAFAAILAASAPASAVRPATIGELARSDVRTVQFRFPWEAKPKPRRRTKRTERARPARPRKPAAGVGRKAPVARSAEKPKAAPVDLSKARLPPDAGPPWIATWREAQEWYAVAARIPAADFAPRFAQDGEAADLPEVMLAYVPADAAAFDEPPATGSDPIASIAPGVPFPPTNPRMAKPEPPSRDGLEPEGRGLAAEGRGLAPEGQGLAQEAPPLPPRRPGDMAALSPEEPPKPPPGPTEPDIPLPVVAHDDDPDCRSLEGGDIADVRRLPPIEGPGVCGGGPLVSLVAIKRADGASIAVKPAATLRCSMAKALAEFVRRDAAPAADGAGLSLARLDIAGSFQCRGRNGAAGGKMSEHGRANAIDVSGFGFSDGRTLGVFSPDLPKPFAESIRSAACDRFSTVLGPGSDGFHDSHLHLDLQPRRSKSKLCQWSDPPVADAADGDEERHEERAKPVPAGESGGGTKSRTAP